MSFELRKCSKTISSRVNSTKNSKRSTRALQTPTEPRITNRTPFFGHIQTLTTPSGDRGVLSQRNLNTLDESDQISSLKEKVLRCAYLFAQVAGDTEEF